VRRERAVGQADCGAKIGRVPPVPAVIRQTIMDAAARRAAEFVSSSNARPRDGG
jgi:hypothetical protein